MMAKKFVGLKIKKYFNGIYREYNITLDTTKNLNNYNPVFQINPK